MKTLIDIFNSVLWLTITDILYWICLTSLGFYLISIILISRHEYEKAQRNNCK